MRVIEHNMMKAILGRKNFRSSNTEVRWEGSHCIVSLFENEIIDWYVGDNTWLLVTDCGWRTSTTKSRLNAILDHLALPRIHQKKHVWYIGDERWSGSKLFTATA
jgi:hypothetical protein